MMLMYVLKCERNLEYLSWAMKENKNIYYGNYKEKQQWSNESPM